MGEKLQFTELDQYLFGQGTHYDIYRKLGAHPDTQNRKKGVYFAVWAPNAQAVSVIGEFNEWDTEKNPMKKVGPIGVYETFVPGAKIGQLYKFYITGAHGEELYKADPYANAATLHVPGMLLLVFAKGPMTATVPFFCRGSRGACPVFAGSFFRSTKLSLAILRAASRCSLVKISRAGLLRSQYL